MDHECCPFHLKQLCPRECRHWNLGRFLTRRSRSHLLLLYLSMYSPSGFLCNPHPFGGVPFRVVALLSTKDISSNYRFSLPPVTVLHMQVEHNAFSSGSSCFYPFIADMSIRIGTIISHCFNSMEATLGGYTTISSKQILNKRRNCSNRHANKRRK